MKKQIFRLTLLGLLLVSCKGAQELDQTLELEGGASHTFSVKGEQERKVGWELVDKAEGNSCPEQQCIKLERKDDFGYIGGQYGAAMNFTPKAGKIDFELKNLAPGKLKVRIYTEKPH